MRTLVVEDDFTSRRLIQRLLEPLGEVDIAVDGKEAMSAFLSSRSEHTPYDLICLDIMMPEMDGHEVLRQVREAEQQSGTVGSDGVKVIMTTALADHKNVMKAFTGQCEAYLPKPIDKQKLYDNLEQLGFGIGAGPDKSGRSS